MRFALNAAGGDAVYPYSTDAGVRYV